jgi:endonuclease/exonuclease/phosphatase family metal-dependent hydrolase
MRMAERGRVDVHPEELGTTGRVDRTQPGLLEHLALRPGGRALPHVEVTTGLKPPVKPTVVVQDRPSRSDHDGRGGHMHGIGLAVPRPCQPFELNEKALLGDCLGVVGHDVVGDNRPQRGARIHDDMASTLRAVGGPAPAGRSDRLCSPVMPSSADELVVASFNIHAGIDGWGRPFDVVGVCSELDADVLVLQESWRPDGEQSSAEQVGEALGMDVREVTLASGRRAGPHERSDSRWMKPFDWRTASHAIFLDSERPFPSSVLRSSRYRDAVPGSWGVAVLSRRRILDHRVVPLERLRRDRANRALSVIGVDVDGAEVSVAGTHMSHLTHGSVLHFRAVAHSLDEVLGNRPAVLAGDMNLWGPPVGVFLGRWRRAVKGNTWPSWRPHSQLDHILVRGLEVTESTVWRHSGSDHRPVRVRVRIAPIR